jgi:hypothetical protein
VACAFATRRSHCVSRRAPVAPPANHTCAPTAVRNPSLPPSRRSTGPHPHAPIKSPDHSPARARPSPSPCARHAPPLERRRRAPLSAPSRRRSMLPTPPLDPLGASTALNRHTLPHTSPEHGSRRPPPSCATEPPRRSFLRPVRALKPSLGGPEAILRPLPTDRSRRPRRSCTAPLPRGPNCEASNLSEDQSANQGYICKESKLSRDLVVKWILHSTWCWLNLRKFAENGSKIRKMQT